ncbi:hypothetical protein DFQ26_006821 [Actinomortierella ambigua]|nr:hypothetical protein DFQ26_006821 [Actinomortierella ambigua]
MYLFGAGDHDSPHDNSAKVAALASSLHEQGERQLKAFESYLSGLSSREEALVEREKNWMEHLMRVAHDAQINLQTEIAAERAEVRQDIGAARKRSREEMEADRRLHHDNL